MVLALAWLGACGESPRPPGLVDSGAADAGLDAARADGAAECVTNLQCDDGVDCTVDVCSAGRCERTPRADRCPSGSACDTRRGCLPRRSCSVDADCGDTDPCTTSERCDTAARFCVFDTQPDGVRCDATGRVCRGGVCACPSARAAACGVGCVDLQSDPDHCGACGNSCGAGSWCDQGQCSCSQPQSWCPRLGCVDLARDVASCGACGNACTGNARCEMGRCVTPCAEGTHRCGDRCLADDDVASCGERCDPCPTPENSTSSCQMGADARLCGFICSLGFHRCDTRCARNDEVATCGDRCLPCPTPANGSPRCVMQRCDIACNSGFHACGDRCADDTSPASCGDRCAPCPTPENAVSTCAAGQCGFVCAAGFRMCNGACSDGTSPLGCGPSCLRCPVPANGRALCANQACTFACNAGTHACGDRCLSDVAPESCGGRCDPCPAPANARATCDDARCGFECVPGFVQSGSECLELPRLVWPPGGSWVTSRRPRLRWRLPAGVSATDPNTDVQVCRDRACSSVLATLSAEGGEGAVTTDLPRATLFWRVRARGVAAAPWTISVSGPGGDSAPEGVAWGTLGDFDGDGFSELTAAAPFLSNPGNRVYVYRGSPGGVLADSRRTLDAPDRDSQFGFAMSAAGDLNGDGYGDLAVGGPGFLSNTGRVYVYFGSATGFRELPDLNLDGPDGPDSFFGIAVTGGGDFNRDGYADLAVGANRAGGGGRVHVYYGSANGPPTLPSLTIQGPNEMGARFGNALAHIGDFDGDGDSDLAVGADGFGSFAGRVFVYRGASTGLDTTAQTLDRPQGGQFGIAVAGVGDVNGDGLPDLAAGATTIDAGRGQLLVYHGGRMGFPTVPSAEIQGPDAQMADFGGAISAAGDLDGDGYGDLLTSAARFDDFTGRAYVYRGGPMGVVVSAPQRLDLMNALRGYFGGALVGGRDYDNDGHGDLAVTAERTTTFTGTVVTYRGGPMGVTAWTTLVGPDGVVSRFGFSVASVAHSAAGSSPRL